MGRTLVEQLKKVLPGAFLMAVGTNSTATAAMLKAGADAGATGQNAVIYNADKADIIVGPMGIVVANAMYGELSPIMAAAIAEAGAKKVLVPVAKCGIIVAGIVEMSPTKYIEEAVSIVKQLAQEICA